MGKSWVWQGQACLRGQWPARGHVGLWGEADGAAGSGSGLKRQQRQCPRPWTNSGVTRGLQPGGEEVSCPGMERGRGFPSWPTSRVCKAPTTRSAWCHSAAATCLLAAEAALGPAVWPRRVPWPLSAPGRTP